MKTLKMWIGNLDGKRGGLIIAFSQSAALRALNKKMRVSSADFERYWCEMVAPYPELKADTVYTAANNGLKWRE